MSNSPPIWRKPQASCSQVRDSGLFSAKALGKAGDQTANQFLVHAMRAAAAR
jgi:hypothetical protein